MTYVDVVIKNGIVLLVLDQNDGFDVGLRWICAEEGVESTLPTTLNRLQVLFLNFGCFGPTVLQFTLGE